MSSLLPDPPTPSPYQVLTLLHSPSGEVVGHTLTDPDGTVHYYSLFG